MTMDLNTFKTLQNLDEKGAKRRALHCQCLPHPNDMLLELGPFLQVLGGKIVWRLNPEAANKKIKQFI